MWMIYKTICLYLINSVGFFLCHHTPQMLRFFVYSYPKSICNHRSDQARVNSEEKPFSSAFPKDLFPTAEEASIGKKTMFLVSALWRYLQFGLDDVLGVRKYPTIDASKTSHYHTFQYGKFLVTRSWDQIIFQQLICCKLSSIGWHLSHCSCKTSSKYSFHSFFLQNEFETLSAIFEFLVIQLHLALDQLHRRHNNCIDEPSESSIFDPVNKTQFLFPCYFLVKFIAPKNNGVDQRHSCEGIKHAIKETHQFPLFPE